MNPVLIQNQTPSGIIFDGVFYNSLNEFSIKNKIYEKSKRKLLSKFIWWHFKKYYQDNTYNVDLADDLEKEEFKLYLKGKLTKKSHSVHVIYKNKLYLSTNILGEELGLLGIEIRRSLQKFGEILEVGKTVIINEDVEKDLEKKIRLKKENKRRDCIRIIYNDCIFKSIIELSKKIKVNTSRIRKYIFKNKIKAKDYEINLNDKKYKNFRNYIEKIDKQKNLIPFEEKVKTFAKNKEIPLNKIYDLVSLRKIKNIEDLKKYYQYLV